MKASDTFRNPKYGHNCAQAVANKWKELFKSDDIVADYVPYVGGHAPGGLCGALYAAMQAVPEHSQQIKDEFVKVCGDGYCKKIKAEHGTPCPICVDTADSLVEKYSKK